MKIQNYPFAIFFFLLFISGPFSVLAQDTGIIRGKIIDDATGEPLFGVTVQIVGTTQGAISDFDGAFEVKVASGTYNLQISFVSYKTVTVENVVVSGNKVAYFDNIRLSEAIEELEAVVITAEVIRDSESAMLTVKRKSANLMDGISAASFRKIGDSNASEAIKRVTGVSIEGGKYVYVRGLGDRYTKTVSNGMEIPGLDPDVNSLQIDIFPTNLLNNLTVLKTSLAELPADFTGGLVNIETKDFPEEKIFDISISIGVTPSMHFNSDYVSYDGGQTDWLGFDDGTRSLSALAESPEVPTPVNSDFSDTEVNDFVKSFDPTLGPEKQTSFMNYGLSASFGDQKTLSNGNKLGYILSTTYKSSVQFFDDQTYGEYQRPGSPDDFELVQAYLQDGIQTMESVLLGGLGGLAYKTDYSKYKLSLMHLQNGESTSGIFFIDDNGEAVGKSGYTADSYKLAYTQRGLTNMLISGDHFTENDKWNFSWKLSPTLSSLSDPDIRKTAFTLNSGSPAFEAGNGGNPSRIWRDLEEINVAAKIDITRNNNLFGRESKLKFGSSYLYKERDYKILFFDLQRFGSAPELSGDPNDVLTDEKIYPTGVFYYQSGNNDPNPNQYSSNVGNFGAYVSSEFKLVEKLKTIVGLRAESYVMRHTGRDQSFAITGQGNNLDNEKLLDSFDLFPSINNIYAITEKQNLRVSYSQSIARPSFKELSFAQILDPISNRTFNGGLFEFIDGEGNVIWDGQLTETRIQNFDLRWEMFMRRDEIFSISAFYKNFEDPIELVRIPAAQTGLEFQPRNVGDGQIFGVEVEFRKALDFISESFSKFSLNGNLTLVQSEIDMTSTEFEAREVFQKTGEDLEDTREMAGQAPYIINGGFSYNNYSNGLEMGLFYNVKGPTLVLVGGGLTPDVFTEPFHSLNFNVNKSIGLQNKVTINFGVSNILNDVREEFFTGFNAQDQPFTAFSPGTTYTLGLKYNIF